MYLFRHTVQLIERKGATEIMTNSTLLNMITKKEDKVVCERCNEGIYIPFRDDVELNHGFTCNKCGVRVNIDPVVEIQ